MRLVEKANSEANAKRIDEFVDKHPELEFRTISTELGTLALIAAKGKEMPLELGKQLLRNQYDVVSPKGGSIRGNCYQVADQAVKAEPKLADGILEVKGPERAYTFNVHAINYKFLTDGSVLGFDLTGEYNLDKSLGRYRIFAIQAKDLDELVGYLKDFFGGTWGTIENINR